MDRRESAARQPGDQSVDPPGQPPLESEETPGRAETVTPPMEPEPAEKRPRWRPRRPRLPRSRRGIAAMLVLFGCLAGAAVAGTVQVLNWTETADFCGRCHTMGPELVAHAAGPHREVTCAECHVEPGAEGWIKAKLNGTRQLVEMALGAYPAPIPPPDHDNLPDVADTCLRCHSVERLATANLVTRVRYTEDEANTRQFVGLMIRPGGGDVFDVNRSVHWHVLRDVEYGSVDDSRSISWVDVISPDGQRREFIAQSEVRVAEDVEPDLDRVKAAGEPRRMDCLDCHNRVGHPIPNPRTGVDSAITARRIDQRLPYIKREAMRILWADYDTVEAADQEADRLRDFYRLRYPDTYRDDAARINTAIDQIKQLYRLTATPEMKVSARTYPDDLGHTDFVGCFRCHNGGMFLVRDGAVTTETIPSRCDACHTFPQVGAVASLPLGIPPDTHDDSLYVFNHRDVATTVDPGGTSCGECHARDYCVNCHVTGAVTVEHDEMLLDHALVIRDSGAEACAYCHQPVYCARCHSEPVMPGGAPWTNDLSGVLHPPPDVRWPLIGRLAE